MTKFEIIDHGVDHAQYFQGCGVSFTKWDECVTGCGSDAAEAYADAVEQVYCQHGDKAESIKLPKRPRGINAKNKVPAQDEDGELYYYVSIRYLTPTK